MKTKTLLLLCFLLGVGLTQISAQEQIHINQNGTGTITGSVTLPDDWPIYKDGVEVDWVYGTVTIHYVDFFKNWNISMVQTQAFGEFISKNFPYEVFKGKEISRISVMVDPDIRTFHLNLIGNMGSHYVVYIAWDVTKYEWSDPINVKKMVFAGNNN